MYSQNYSQDFSQNYSRVYLKGIFTGISTIVFIYSTPIVYNKIINKLYDIIQHKIEEFNIIHHIRNDINNLNNDINNLNNEIKTLKNEIKTINNKEEIGNCLTSLSYTSIDSNIVIKPEEQNIFSAWHYPTRKNNNNNNPSSIEYKSKSNLKYEIPSTIIEYKLEDYNEEQPMIKEIKPPFIATTLIDYKQEYEQEEPMTLEELKQQIEQVEDEETRLILEKALEKELENYLEK